MPNWCNNNLTVSGDTASLKDFIEKSIKKDENGEYCLTFQGVLPRPKELDITSGSSTSNGRDVINAEENNDWKGIDEKLQWPVWVEDAKITSDMSPEIKRQVMLAYLKNKLTEKDISEARQSFKNQELFGHMSWYEWNTANWGTKWDAADSHIEKMTLNELIVQFDTAWAPPIPWVIQCEKMYPLLTFSLDYEEPGMNFAGTYSKGTYTERECTDRDDELESPQTETV